MKLKKIPEGTVVHTTAEQESEELLAILRENGYKWCGEEELVHTNYNIYIGNTCYCLKLSKRVTYSDKNYFIERSYPILTLAEFKEKYCEDEKPQPKFKVGDKVRVINYDHTISSLFYYKNTICRIVGITRQGFYELELVNKEDKSVYVNDALDRADEFIKGIQWCEFYLEPYTEPETKPTIKETKESEETFASEELNLLEILKGCDNERFYCIMWGDTNVVQFYDCGMRIAACTDHDTYITIDVQGKCEDDGVCLLWPSRALYKQYPLDAAKAWSVWQEERKKPFICIHWGGVDCNGDEEEDCTGNIYFRTLADRYKFIEELKAIIEKHINN